MSQLNFASIPGFFDISDAVLVGGQPVTDDLLTKISHNGKLGIVRCEIFDAGFFGPGDTVAVPTSPVDGYVYPRAELVAEIQFRSSRSPAPGYTPGQATFPVLNNVSPGSGAVLEMPYNVQISPTTGALTVQCYYAGNGAQNTGTVKVIWKAQRSSVQSSS